jgi:hypothetical protein
LATSLLKALLETDELSTSYHLRREVITGQGGRMDLIISSETELIAIENKLFHDVSNPFPNMTGT